MFDVLLSIAISFTITFLAIPVIITVAERKKLFDIPDERKIHQTPIPSLGGLGIYAGFILASLITIQFETVSERSEERRVGKECRSRWSRDHETKEKK